MSIKPHIERYEHPKHCKLTLEIAWKTLEGCGDDLKPWEAEQWECTKINESMLSLMYSQSAVKRFWGKVEAQDNLVANFEWREMKSGAYCIRTADM
jgi:hypothetical protein